MKSATSNKLMKIDETAAYYGEVTVDLCSGKHSIFIYTNIIEYQYIDDTKPPCFESLIQNNVLKTVVPAILNQLIGLFFRFRLQKNVYQTLYSQYRLSFTHKRENWFPFREPVKLF